MAMPLRMKRMVKEREVLEKPNDDYFVHFEDDNLFSFYAFVIGPADTLYAHKYIKLKFDIPQRYPFVEPKCTFIQHSGGRLHPNLYVEGKVCLSILGTWSGEKWAFAMSIDTVLITIRSLLDNAPYKHEPGQADNANFNRYVQYTSWKSLLLDYVNNERDPAAKAFLQKHISDNSINLVNELKRQAKVNAGSKQLTTPYGVGRGGKLAEVDYDGLLREVTHLVDQCKTAEAARQAIIKPAAMLPQNVFQSPVANGNHSLESEELCSLCGLLICERACPQYTSLQVPEPSETQHHVSISETNDRSSLSSYTSPPESSERKPPPTATLSLQVNKIGVSPSLKRKHDVIDLT